MQTIININRNKPTNVNMNGIETKRAFCIVIRCYAFNKYEYKFDKWGAFNHKVTCAKWHSLPFFSPGYHSDKTKYSFAKFTICHSRYAFNGNVFLLNSSNKFWTNREKIDTTTLPCVWQQPVSGEEKTTQPAYFQYTRWAWISSSRAFAMVSKTNRRTTWYKTVKNQTTQSLSSCWTSFFSDIYHLWIIVLFMENDNETCTFGRKEQKSGKN